MWKKLSLLLMACMVALSFSVPASVDAASYKAPKRSYSPSTGSTTTTPNSGINKNEPAASKTPQTTTNPATAQKGGFFSGGLMKGLMIGGLAGLLFGGLFGNMGFMGNLLGMMVNVLALVVLFAVIRAVFVYFRNRKKFDHNPKRY